MRNLVPRPILVHPIISYSKTTVSDLIRELQGFWPSNMNRERVVDSKHRGLTTGGFVIYTVFPSTQNLMSV